MNEKGLEQQIANVEKTVAGWSPTKKEAVGIKTPELPEVEAPKVGEWRYLVRWYSISNPQLIVIKAKVAQRAGGMTSIFDHKIVYATDSEHTNTRKLLLCKKVKTTSLLTLDAAVVMIQRYEHERVAYLEKLKNEFLQECYSAKLVASEEKSK